VIFNAFLLERHFEWKKWKMYILGYFSKTIKAKAMKLSGYHLSVVWRETILQNFYMYLYSKVIEIEDTEILKIYFLVYQYYKKLSCRKTNRYIKILEDVFGGYILQNSMQKTTSLYLFPVRRNKPMNLDLWGENESLENAHWRCYCTFKCIGNPNLKWPFKQQVGTFWYILLFRVIA